MKKTINLTVFLMLASFLFSGLALGEVLKPVKLPKPQTTGGKPLMEALSERQSVRDFGPEELSPQTLSGLLWAANGVNRPDGRRTAPSAHNAQEVDIYVALKEGLYLYDAGRNELAPVVSGDVRARAGKQSFVKKAPAVLIYVADLEKLQGDAAAEFYGIVDAGFVSQNVYLYCASSGLATVALNWVDKGPLAQTMKLRRDQRIILTQPVGYPKK